MFFEPWKYVSTRDELSAHLQKLWSKKNIEKYSSDWSDRGYHKHTIAIEPETKNLGSDTPSMNAEQPKIVYTYDKYNNGQKIKNNF